MLWNDDLDEFLEKLQEVEDKEIADQAESKPAKGAKGKKKTFKQETMASPSGIRVAVKVSFSNKNEGISLNDRQLTNWQFNNLAIFSFGNFQF